MNRKLFQMGGLLIALCLLAPGGFAADDAALSADQEKALETLIDSLQALKATPDSAAKIKEMIGVDTEQIKAEIEEFQTQISDLKTRIEEAEARREKLNTRLNALKAAKVLLGLEESAQAAPTAIPENVAEPAAQSAAAAPSGGESSFFHSKVWPILQTNCFECHGADTQKAGLRLDSLEAMIQGGDFGSVLEPGNIEKSYLVEVIRYTGDTKMPPKQKLPDESIEILVQWVKDGAEWPESGGTSSAGKADAPAVAVPKTETAKAESEGNPGEILFTTQILPILQTNCFECHGPETQKSGLRLDSLEAILKGGDFGKILEPGDPENSYILKTLNYDGDVAMPPKEKLPQEDIDAIREWIELGAPWPKDKVSQAVPSDSGDAPAPTAPARSEALAAHPIPWSFEPVAEVSPEKAAEVVDNRGWIESPIDVFILRKLEEAGLTPSPPADRRQLIRRVSFGLTGLPPTPAEIQDFLSDSSPDAYEKVIDRLLASPRYGERWARHWLDVVRFAETNGYETNTPRPNAWPYRDYVIEAFNEDKPYDRFILEQLAGDVLGEDRATGFLVGGPTDIVSSPDVVLTRNQRANDLSDMISTTSTAFLGLTVACARCHDHKFDPIAQTDYYRLQAVFSGVHHGEREIEPADYAERLAAARELRTDLAPILERLSKHQPNADPDLILIDDGERLVGSTGSLRAEELVESNDDGKSYTEGTERGQLDDPGSETRLPNLGRKYTHWSEGDLAGRDLFVWTPGISGSHRIWLSWGCGWDSRAKDASYHLDRDGDLETHEDRVLLAKVDQRHFADGDPAPFGQPLWSGFQDAGVHELDESSRIVLQAGTGNASVSADLIALRRVDAKDAAGGKGNAVAEIRPRSQPTPMLNEEKFPPLTAKAVRFEVLATNSLEPCIDELEVFSTGPEPRNVALASAGAEATASGTYPGAAIHRLEHINDGAYGNSRSWISDEKGGGWVRIDFPEEEEIDRIVWARDREGNYRDRLAVRYRISALRPDGDWVQVASSDDRSHVEEGRVNRETYSFVGLTEAESEELRTLIAEKERIETKIVGLEKKPRVYSGRFEKPEETFRYHRGDPMLAREKVHPGGIVALANLPLHLGEDVSDSERRLALAEWIADERNPLTARVMVNRVWQHHFGRGLVDTPSEFGNLSLEPTHPELLDYLSARFVEQGWSLKELHRAILFSNAYRQSSAPREEPLEVDADSRLLWRFPPLRLEAEPIRDSILAVSGNLDLTMGGPGYEVFEPNSNYVRVYEPKKSFGPAEWRRMIYQFKPRMEHDATFGAFDCPDAALPTPKRTRSTTALQALNLLNSPFVLQQCGVFAARLLKEGGDSREGQVNLAFELTFGRPAAREEVEAATALIENFGLPVFCRALFNANEFLYVD